MVVSVSVFSACRTPAENDRNTDTSSSSDVDTTASDGASDDGGDNEDLSGVDSSDTTTDGSPPCSADGALGESCTVGTGECSRTGTVVCDRELGSPTCDVEPGAPSDEVCDGKDNDCDGSTDETLTQECSNQTGVCAGATVACSGGTYPSCGASEFGPDYESTETRCDGKDNDCDGNLDDGCPWTRLIGTSERDRASAVTTDRQGHVYVVGDTEKGLHGRTFNGGTDDVYVVKYDGSGHRRWTRLIGTSGFDDAEDVTTDRQGNLYVTGNTEKGLNGETYNGGSLDAYLVYEP